MTADVISLPKSFDALEQRIRSAFDRAERGTQEWIEGTLELACAMSEARGRFSSNQEFSHWIVDRGLEQISFNDRVALIGMARDLEFARRVLMETRRSSWQWIWREEIEPRLCQMTKTPPPTKISAKSPLYADAESVSANIIAPLVASSIQSLKKSSALYGWPRADEVAAIYPARARSQIGSAIKARGGKEIWSLILQSIDEGFLKPTSVNFSKVTLCVLFPEGNRSFCAKFDLTNPKERQHVRDRIMPAATANREAVIQAPERLEAIVAAHWQNQQDAVQEAASQLRVAEAIRSMPSEEREIMMFGVRLWPRVDHWLGTYDYEQLCAAVWYFQDLDSWLRGSIIGKTAGSRAIVARLSTKWPQEYVDRACDPDTRGKIKKVYQLVHTLAGLLEKNSDGECIVPPTPKIEGQSW